MKKVWALFITAAAAAVFLGWITSQHHLGLTEDGLRYLSMAKHAAAGKGFSIYNPSIAPASLPYISQAPLWSALISLGLTAGLSPEFWTWLCVILLWGLNIFMAGLTVLYGTKRLSGALAAQFLVLSDVHILMHHAYVLSEPLFFLLTQAAVLLLWVYLDSGRVRWLVLAIITTGLIGITRYIGITYAAGLALGILILDRKRLKDRVMTAVFCGLLGGAPLGLWFLRHFLLRHEWFGMHVAESQTHHFFLMDVAASFWERTTRYPIDNGWLPDRTTSTWVILGIVLTGVLFFVRQDKSKTGARGSLLLVLFPAVYGIGMIGAWTARSVQSYPDAWRLSAPIFLHLWVFLAIFISRAVGEHSVASERSRPRMILCRATLILLLFWGVGLVPKTYAWMSRAVTTGEYGRDDSIPWAAANRIMWFPPS